MFTLNTIDYFVNILYALYVHQHYQQQIYFKPFHPYRPVWYVPDQGMDYTILDT